MENEFIIPRVGEVIKKPVLGSGKILRKVTIKNKRTSKNSFKNIMLKRKTNNSITKDKKKPKPIIFGSVEIKIIFEFWNRQGFPFVSHKLSENKTSITSIEKISNALGKTKKDKIIKAIETCHYLFSSSWFKYKHYYSSNKITLANFFSYDKKRYRAIATTIPDYPKSWFKECLKGRAYITNAYSAIKKDKYPNITKKLIKTWQVFSNNNNQTVLIKNNLIEVSEKINLFSINNNYDHNVICSLIEKMLNKWNTIKPGSPNYFLNDRFWESTIPNELIRYGIADKNKQFIF